MATQSPNVIQFRIPHRLNRKLTIRKITNMAAHLRLPISQLLPSQIPMATNTRTPSSINQCEGETKPIITPAEMKDKNDMIRANIGRLARVIWIPTCI